jgi:hypothetical protein
MNNGKEKRRICVICGAEFTAPDSYYERRTCSEQCRLALIQRNRLPDNRDISDQRFGRLVAICETDVKRAKSLVWLCKCDCGNTVLVPATSLRGGTTKSCGCWKCDNARITAAGNVTDSTHTGVSKRTARGMFFTYKILNGHQHFIGEFKTREAAEEMRRIAQQVPDDEFLNWLSALRESRKKEKALKKKGK